MSTRKTRIDKGVPRVPKATMREIILDQYTALTPEDQDRVLEDCSLIRRTMRLTRPCDENRPDGAVPIPLGERDSG